MKTKTYNIDSFEKLINIANKENVERLASDLCGWLLYSEKVISEVREKYPKETEGKSNSEILICKFTWVDDGKNDMLGVDIENKETGEIQEIRF